MEGELFIKPFEREPTIDIDQFGDDGTDKMRAFDVKNKPKDTNYVIKGIDVEPNCANYRFLMKKAAETEFDRPIADDIEALKDFICFSDEEDGGCDYDEWFGGYEKALGKEKQCVNDGVSMNVRFDCKWNCPLARLLNETKATYKKYKYQNGYFFKPDRRTLPHNERLRIKEHIRLHSDIVREGNFLINGKQQKGLWLPSENVLS